MRWVGDGAKGGWKTGAENALSITVGNDSLSGTLTIDGAHISWDGKVLYSADMSTLSQPLHVVYTAGKAGADGIPSGFYVWLGERLIGEALPTQAPADSGIKTNIKAKVVAPALHPEPVAPLMGK